MSNKSLQFEKLMMHHLSESISDADAHLLVEMLNSDPKYKAQYNELVKTRALLLTPDIESQRTSNFKNLSKSLNNGSKLNTQPTLFNTFLRYAAIIVFVLSTSYSTYSVYNAYINSSDKMSYQTIVPLGSQTKIILPDGTVAWLNSGSTLKYNSSYGKKNRTVELTGEGYFEVQKNPENPFFVKVDNLNVKVLGTVFNVRSYADESTVEVNLLEGKVSIGLNQSNSATCLTLLPNERMVYNKRDKSLLSYKVDASRSALWTTGKLCFVDASLEDITKDLERKYDVKIAIHSQTIKDELFSGSLDLNQPIEKVLEYIDVDNKYSRLYSGKSISINNKN